MFEVGKRFVAYDDSIGNSACFWVDTLYFKLQGDFKKGDVVELVTHIEETHQITLIVEKVEDDSVVDIFIPISAVGLDKDLVLEEHESIIYSLTDIKNDNRVFLLILCIPFNKRKRIRIPLGETQNILEYTYEGLW